jgi:hypothetical protein
MEAAKRNWARPVSIIELSSLVRAVGNENKTGKRPPGAWWMNTPFLVASRRATDIP